MATGLEPHTFTFDDVAGEQCSQAHIFSGDAALTSAAGGPCLSVWEGMLGYFLPSSTHHSMDTSDRKSTQHVVHDALVHWSCQPWHQALR